MVVSGVVCVLNSCLLVGTNSNERQQAGENVFSENKYTQILSERATQPPETKPSVLLSWGLGIYTLKLECA